jgi:hypothetical protein
MAIERPNAFVFDAPKTFLKTSFRFLHYLQQLAKSVVTILVHAVLFFVQKVPILVYKLPISVSTDNIFAQIIEKEKGHPE